MLAERPQSLHPCLVEFVSVGTGVGPDGEGGGGRGAEGRVERGGGGVGLKRRLGRWVRLKRIKFVRTPHAR